MLRRFIPETLFYNTNLPLIKARLQDEKSPVHEQPDIALAYLIPGRVTYRYGHKGYLIPVRSPPDPVFSSVFSLIIPKSEEDEIRRSPYNRRYIYSNYELERCESSPTRYVHELMYALEKLNITRRNIRCFELRGAYLHVFRPWGQEDPESSKDFGKFAYSVRKGSMYDAEYYIKKRRPGPIAQISSKTVSYPRIGAFFTGEQSPLRYYEQHDIYLPHLRVDYYERGDLIRYVYAHDMKVYYRVLTNNPGEEDLRKDKRSGRYVRSLTKILSYGNLREGGQYSTEIKPSVIGYRIEGTSYLKLVFTKSSIEESLGKLLKITKSWLDLRTASPKGEFYVALSVCQTLRDSLLYILTEDLYSSISRSRVGDRGILKNLTRMALLYGELNEPLCKLLLSGKAEMLRNLRNLLSGALIELCDTFRAETLPKGNKKKLARTKPYVIT
ncbi:MAG: hypothetical protein QXW58_06360, partial [Thermosphaera sp.]